MFSNAIECFATGAGVLLFALGAYGFFVFLWPEWVGLTGEVAKESEKSHVGGEVQESSFWKKLDAEPVKRPPDKV